MNGQYAIQVYYKLSQELVLTLGNDKVIPMVLQSVQLIKMLNFVNYEDGKTTFKLSQIQLKRITLSFAETEEHILVLYSKLQTMYGIYLAYILAQNYATVPSAQLMSISVSPALYQILKMLYLQGQIHYIQILNEQQEQEVQFISYMRSSGFHHAQLFLTKNKRVLAYNMTSCSILLYLNRKQQMDEYGAIGSLGWARNDGTCRLIIDCIDEASGILVSYGADLSQL